MSRRAFITMNTMTTETLNTTAPELALKVGYGWFSRSYKTNGHDTHLYLDGTGARVEVSCVTRGTKHETGWDDIVYVGQVFKYVESIKNIRQSNQYRPFQTRCNY